MSRVCILDILAKGLDEDKISHGAYDAFHRAYDDGASLSDSMKAMRDNTNTDNFNRARDLERWETLKDNVLGTQKDEGINNLLAPSASSAPNTINLHSRSGSVEGQLRRHSIEVDAKFGTRVSNLLRTNDRDNEMLTRAILEPNTTRDVTPEMQAHAKAVGDMYDDARLLANREGMKIGDIRTKDRGYLPQSHNASALRKMGLDGWSRLILPKLDLQRMGYATASDEDINTMLKEVYETITTNGLNKRDIELRGGVRGKGALSNSRQEHRFLHYNSADDWIDYAKATNDGVLPNTYTNVRNDIRRFSNEIAQLQIFGQNPQRMFDDLVQFAKDNDKYDKSLTSQNYTGQMYRVATGQADMNTAHSRGGRALATTAGTFRSLKIAGSLGGAVLSSIPDTFTSALASAMTGNNPFSVLGKQLGTLVERAMKGGSPAERELIASRIGIVSDAFMTEISNSRWAETGGGLEGVQKIAEGVIRASGLPAWTNALRTTWSLEFTGLLHDNVGKQLDSFPMGRRMKKHYGITDAEWAKIDKSMSTDGFLDTTAIFKTDSDLALRIQDIIADETNLAVIMPDPRTRAITTGGEAKGTLAGEARRTVTMFKSFPIAYTMAQYGRMMQIDGINGKFAYAGALTVGMGAMGTLVVLPVKDMLKGKTPQDPTTGKAWMRGFLQSGGLGVFGDLVSSSQTRFGTTPAETMLLGVGASPINDTVRIIQAGLDVADEDYDGAMSKVVDTALKYVPAQNLWYTRLAYERAFSDQVRSMTNSKWSSRLAKQKRKMEKETGQSYWAEPTK